MTRDIVLFARPPTTSLVRRLGQPPDVLQYSYERINHLSVYSGLGFNLINTLASTPGMPCHCRAGVRTTQLLVNAKLTSISKHLDDLDATLASSSLPDWTGTAAESYRARLDELRKQSLTLRDSINATLRLLWAVGAA